jgi:hypothetical protein
LSPILINQTEIAMSLDSSHRLCAPRFQLHEKNRVAISRACIETLEDRKLLSFAAAVNYPVGTGPQSVVTADFNGDGKLDLATANFDNSNVSVRLGDGAGGFGAVTGFATTWWPSSLAVGDFDADGKLDLAAFNTQSDSTGYFYVLYGRGNGTFLAPAIDGFPQDGLFALAAADFNGDGRSDVVYLVDQWVEGIWINYVRVRISDGQRGFTGGFGNSLNGSDTVGLAVGDLNADGKVDVVTANDAAGTVSVLLGNGDGTLNYDSQHPRDFAAGQSPQAVAIGDFTGDGKPDLVVAGQTVSTLRGRGDGTFDAPVSHPLSGSPHTAVATADFNGNGKLDAVVTDNTGAVSLMLGNGNGALTYAGSFPTGTSPSGAVVGDFDRDGQPDVAVSNAGSNNVSVLLNSADSVAPTIGAAAFPYLLAPHRISIPFSEPVGPSLSLSDITVQNLTTATTVNPVSLSYDAATNTATFWFAGVLPDGNYRATIATANVTDLAGNPMSSDFSFDFFILAGDADRDRDVDVSDLGILATNWQQSPRTFSQGDFDYSGMVDVNDLGILATNWQQNVAPPGAPVRTSPRRNRVALDLLVPF